MTGTATLITANPPEESGTVRHHYRLDPPLRYKVFDSDSMTESVRTWRCSTTTRAHCWGGHEARRWSLPKTPGAGLHVVRPGLSNRQSRS